MPFRQSSSNPHNNALANLNRRRKLIMASTCAKATRARTPKTKASSPLHRRVTVPLAYVNPGRGTTKSTMLRSYPSERALKMAASSAEFCAGALFGSALLVSGVYSPAVIVSQLKLSNFHMLETFMTASAVSAVLINAADRSGLVPIQPRPPRTIGVLTELPFSANVVGGALLGLGMALTGACPGTVLVQIATGITSGLYVCAGGLAGGVLYSILEPYIHSTERAKSTSAPEKRSPKSSDTLQSRLRVSADLVLVAYEGLCLLAIAASVKYAPKTTSGLYSPAAGGILIGLAQAATLLMTRRTVGVSRAYGDIAKSFVNMFESNKKRVELLTPATLFALGILTGSAIIGVTLNIPSPSPLLSAGPSPIIALAGGVASIFGARVAGGCTSGHGISGMATFSTASFLSVAAMFGGGIIATGLMN